MKTIRDPVVGELTYREFWERDVSITIFGSRYPVALSFEGEIDEELDEGQRHAFTAFERNRMALLQAAEARILEYYQRVLPEYQARFGETASERLPAASEPGDLAVAVVPRHLWFPTPLRAGERVVGLLCDCSWEPGLGLAVRFVNEEAIEVGPQDIVL